MSRAQYLELAAAGLCMPIGTDLVLHEEADPEQARRNGRSLAAVIERAARRWKTPLAFPLMDLRLDKMDLLASLGVAEEDSDSFHFSEPIPEAEFARLLSGAGALVPGSVARDEALEYIAELEGLIPIGMLIGPFSLVTRLMKDPITAAGLAGGGMTAEDAPEVRLLMQCLEVAQELVLRSALRQIAHGAKAMLVCEPAANTSFLSPRQINRGSGIFDVLVMQPNLRLVHLLEEHGVDLIFHNCGELTPKMVEAFATELHPVILSFGSSRKLWEDAELVPSDVVLYGNLPSKLFYSDEAMPAAGVERMRDELFRRMSACGHPFICGTECDVLYVPDAKEAIARKVAVLSGWQAGQAAD